MDIEERISHIKYSSDCSLKQPTPFYNVKQKFCWKCFNEVLYKKPLSPPSSPVSSPRKYIIIN